MSIIIYIFTITDCRGNLKIYLQENNWPLVKKGLLHYSIFSYIYAFVLSLRSP